MLAFFNKLVENQTKTVLESNQFHTNTDKTDSQKILVKHTLTKRKNMKLEQSIIISVINPQ